MIKLIGFLQVSVSCLHFILEYIYNKVSYNWYNKFIHGNEIR